MAYEDDADAADVMPPPPPTKRISVRHRLFLLGTILYTQYIVRDPPSSLLHQFLETR